MKNSDPNHPKVLYRVYYPPYVIPKTFGAITLKLLGYPCYLIKILYNLHSPSVHENCAKLGTEMKNSDPNHPKEPYMVHYPPYLVPKIIRDITLKLLGYPCYLFQVPIV